MKELGTLWVKRLEVPSVMIAMNSFSPERESVQTYEVFPQSVLS